MELGENIAISEPAIQAAAFTACFTLIMYMVKTVVEARASWRGGRIERISKLLDAYYWPLCLVLHDLRDVQTVLEGDSEHEQFKETAIKRKVELCKRLRDVMTSGIAMAQPRSLLVAPILACYQQIGFLQLGSDVTSTLSLTHIDVLLSLVRERLRQFQREYNNLTASPVFKSCRSEQDTEPQSTLETLRKLLNRTADRKQEFEHVMNIFNVSSCSADACQVDPNMSKSARSVLSTEFAKAYRRSQILKMEEEV